MPVTRIILDLPEALANELERIAEAFEIRDVNEAALKNLVRAAVALNLEGKSKPKPKPKSRRAK